MRSLAFAGCFSDGSLLAGSPESRGECSPRVFAARLGRSDAGVLLFWWVWPFQRRYRLYIHKLHKYIHICTHTHTYVYIYIERRCNKQIQAHRIYPYAQVLGFWRSRSGRPGGIISRFAWRSYGCCNGRGLRNNAVSSLPGVTLQSHVMN